MPDNPRAGKAPAAVLLCAGFGTRMYPLTRTVPKSLLDVAGRPVLDYLMQQLVECGGLGDIHIVANNRFHAQFLDWSTGWEPRLARAGIRLRIYNNGVDDNEGRLGAVGDLAYVLEHGALWGRDLLIAAGDNIFLFDVCPVWQHFLASRSSQLLAICEPDMQRLRKMGVLTIGKGDRVLAFHEKSEAPASPWVCPALYCLAAADAGLVRDYLQGPGVQDAIGYFLQYLAQHASLQAFRVEGRRLDIGSMEDYTEALRLLSRGAQGKA